MQTPGGCVVLNGCLLALLALLAPPLCSTQLAPHAALPPGTLVCHPLADATSRGAHLEDEYNAGTLHAVYERLIRVRAEAVGLGAEAVCLKGFLDSPLAKIVFWILAQGTAHCRPAGPACLLYPMCSH